ncbi:hypothetical protein V8E55_002764 [Tylopilus felleus]
MFTLTYDHVHLEAMQTLSQTKWPLACLAIAYSLLIASLMDRTLLCGTRDPKECTNITTFSAERLVTSFVVMSDVAIRWERRSR